MAVFENSGVLEEDSKQLLWKITHFFALSTNVGDGYESRRFSFAGEAWNLRIYPGGYDTDASGWISLFLCKKLSSTKCSVEHALDLQKVDGSLLKNNKVTRFIFEVNLHGYRKFIKRSDLVDSKSELVPSDVLTLVCTIKKGSPLPEVTAADMKFSELDTLSKHFEDLMSHRKSCDVTLLVGGKSFQVHKSVLIARSPVFSAMFEHEMSESQNGTVNIPDCDGESFGTFLEYLYSGRIKGVSFGNTLHLYRTAHKYEVQ